MGLVIKFHPLCFHGSISAPATECPLSSLHLGEVTVGAAKFWFRCARVLWRVPFSKCPFAEHIFTPRSASVKSAKPAHAAGWTKSLTPVLKSPSEY